MNSTAWTEALQQCTPPSHFDFKILDIPNFKSVVENEFDNLLKQNKKVSLTKKIDLHGSSLSEANTIVENFINDCFELGYKKLIIITGKGSRSKNFDNPYQSEKMSVLKYSVPEYIKNNLSLLSKINRITKASQEDGGNGAFYIFLKNNKKL